MIVDECDANLSKKFIDSLCHSGAKAVYGLTGTAYRKELDNNDLQKIYGKQVELPDAGYEFVPRIEMLKYKSPKYQYETFAELKTLMVEDAERVEAQVKVIEKLRKERACVLVLTERVDEAAAYAEAVEGSILITGSTKEKDDEEALKRVYS